MRKTLILLAGLAAAPVAAPVAVEPVTAAETAAETATGTAAEASTGTAEALFATGLLDGMAPGTRLIFAHERAGDFPEEALAKVEGGVVEIEPVAVGDGPRTARLELTGARGTPTVAELPLASGHPLLILFLENTARNMAELTRGNPAYIRNRMREALGGGGTAAPVELAGMYGPTTQFSFRPFETDPNRARMGAFADLELRFVLGDAVPGRFAVLTTQTGPGADGTPAYLETMRFDHVEED